MIRTAMTLAATGAALLVLRHAVRAAGNRVRVRGAARRVAWCTGLALLVGGLCVVADVTLRPSETLRPGWTGAAIVALLAALVVLGAVSPASAARVVRRGALATTAFLLALTASAFVFHRAEFDELNVTPLVTVLVFVVVPALFAASFLALAGEQDRRPIAGDRPAPPGAMPRTDVPRAAAVRVPAAERGPVTASGQTAPRAGRSSGGARPRAAAVAARLVRDVRRGPRA